MNAGMNPAAMNAAIGAAMKTAEADAPLHAQQAEARRLARIAAAVLVLGLAPVLGWLAWAPLSSAVVASAFVKVDLDRRPVQHADGGTVREVLVRDGQQVKLGQPLLVLGDVSVDADMNRLTYRVAVEHASAARLEAEQAMSAAISWPPEVMAATRTDARVAEQVAKEKSLFATRREALLGQTSLLRSQRGRIVQEREALRAQIEQADRVDAAPEGRARDQPQPAEGRLHLADAHLAARGHRRRLRRQGRGAALGAGARGVSG